MKKFISILALLILTACTQVQNDTQQQINKNNPLAGRESTKISFETQNGPQEIQIYISETLEERSQGLMYVEDLPQDHGMLFVSDEMHSPNFWMKNTKIPLDFVYLDDVGQVVELLKNVPPCTHENDFYCEHYVPEELSQYVLEVNAGWIEEGKDRNKFFHDFMIN